MKLYLNRYLHVQYCALCVIKSANEHRMKFTLKYPDVSGLFLAGIAGFS